MWAITFLQHEPQELPAVTVEAFVTVALVMLVFRLGINMVVEKCFHASMGDTTLSTLDHWQWYHVAIIMIVLVDLNWNMFDGAIWVLTYVCVGMIRKAIHQINLNKDRMLNDYSYNHKLMPLLISSKFYGLLLLLLSIGYFAWVHFLFLGVEIRVITLLCFPIVMLGVDAFFLVLCSVLIKENLLCFYNPNINQLPPTYRYEMWHCISSSSLRIWHYYNLLSLFVRSIYYGQELFDCMWVFSIAVEFYKSSQVLLTTFNKVRNFNKLNENIKSIFVPNRSAKDDNCVICMEPLLNCHRLTQCGHLIHYKCFFQWVQVKYECPVCRAKIHLNGF